MDEIQILKTENGQRYFYIYSVYCYDMDTCKKTYIDSFTTRGKAVYIINEKAQDSLSNLKLFGKEYKIKKRVVWI